MIKKRLVNLMANSKKYIIYNVVWQWLALAASIVMMMTAGRLLEWAWAGQLTSFQLVGATVIVVTGILWRMYCSRQAARVSYLAGSDVKKKLRQKLYEKLMSFGASYYERIPTAEAVQVAVEGVEQLEVYFGKYLPQLFYSLLAPLTLFAVLSFISLKASIVLLICVPLIPLIIMAVQKLAKRLLNKYWGIYTQLGDSFLETLQGLTTLKIYEADGIKAAEMDREAEHFRKITMKVLMMQLNSIIVMDVVAYGGAAAGIIITLLEYRAGGISLSGAVTMILLSAEFFIPMRMLGSFFHIAMNGMAASDKLFAILDIPAERGGDTCLEGSVIQTVIDSLTFSYEPERPVLKKVSLKLPPVGMVSLVGQSGCGKSTIASLLMGSSKGYTGSIRLNGVQLSQISEESLMSCVTLVSHNSYIFKGTVEENLRMAAPEVPKQRLEAVLQEVNLYDFLVEQEGLQTKIAERGTNLSGGQCQRLALARALLHDTPFYIFDEATSNIDAESECQIMEVIRRLARNHSVLMISHRLANVVDSEMIYVLENGQIAEEGRHGELLVRKGVYANLYMRQKELEEYPAAQRDADWENKKKTVIPEERLIRTMEPIQERSQYA